MMRSLLVFIFLLFCASQASAWPADIGPEIALRSAKTQRALLERRQKKKPNDGNEWEKPTREGEYAEAIVLKDEILRQCGGCTVTTVPGKFEGLDEFVVTFPNQYWVKIGVDPGVVELQCQHLPLEKYEELADLVQTNIYDRAASLGLHPQDEDAHLNFGAKSAFDTVAQLGASLLDQANHPELAKGVLGVDLRAARPLTNDKLALLYQQMDRLAQGKFPDLTALAQAIDEHVYRDNLHDQAVRVDRLEDGDFPEIDRPIEVRYPRTMPTFRGQLKMYRLFQERMAYLRKRGFENLQRQVFPPGPPLSGAESKTRFAILLAEMGKPLAEYEELLPNHLRKARLDAFFVGNVNWQSPQQREEVFRYLPDAEISEWVLARFHYFLGLPSTPLGMREHILTELKKRADSERTPPANRRVLRTFVEAERAVHPFCNLKGVRGKRTKS